MTKEMHSVFRVLCDEFEMVKCELCGPFVYLVVDPYLGNNSILIWHHISRILSHGIHIEHIVHGNQRKWRRKEQNVFAFANCKPIKDLKLLLQNEIHSPGVYLTPFSIAYCIWYMIYHHFEKPQPSSTDSMMLRLKMPQTFHYYGPFVF